MAMHDSDDDDSGGYGRPPKQHQFQPGESGNPRGRPRTGQTVPEIVARVRDELIPITINGRRKRVRIFEAALRQSIALCLKNGNPRHLEKLLELLEKHGVAPRDVMAEQAKAGAEATVRKLFELLERTHPVKNQVAQTKLERREIEIIERYPGCRAALQALWAEQDADPGGTAPSRLRSQLQPARTSED
jgi:hypothetical protein